MRAATAPAPNSTIAIEARLPDVAPGLHRIVVEDGRHSETATLVAAPLRSYVADSFRHGWGVFAPTYALRGGPDLGSGHLGHLECLGRWLGKNGGSYVATLPLLPTFLGPIRTGVPLDPSPYTPVSRRYWNEALLDPAVLGVRPAPRPPSSTVDWARVGDRVRRALDGAVARAADRRARHAASGARRS